MCSHRVGVYTDNIINGIFSAGKLLNDMKKRVQLLQVTYRNDDEL